MVSYTKALIKGLSRPVFIFLTFLSLTVMFFSGLAFYYIERGTNPNIQTLFDAFYFSVTTMSGVGFGDITPVTILGRVCSIFMMLGGTAIFVSFTAVLASILLELELVLESEKENK